MTHFLTILFSLSGIFAIIYANLSSPSTHLDIVFVLDTTGSMGIYIAATKQIIESVIKKYEETNKDVRFGMVAYRDFPPEDNTYITKILQLTDAKTTLNFLRELNADGGGDEPEAVLKALYDGSTAIQWRNIENGKEGGTKYKKGEL